MLTEEQKQEIKDQYKIRFKRQLMASIPVILIIVAMAVFSDKLESGQLPISETQFGIAFCVFVFAVLVFSFKNWRCPACNKYLGKSINHKFCPKCGVELT